MGKRDKNSKNFSIFTKLSLSLIAVILAFSYSFTVNAAEPDSIYEVTVDTDYKSLGEKEAGDPENKVSDTRFTSALWHDIAVQYQGGNRFMIAGVWDIPKQKYEAKKGDKFVESITFADDYTYKLHLNCGLNDGEYDAEDLARLVVWEYELKTFKNKAGKTVEYYERVPKAESPVVTYANENVIVLGNLNPKNPIAIMVDHGQEVAIANETQAAMDEDGYKYDPYWHLYYTDGYIKNHNNFDIEFYNYEKSVEEIGGKSVPYITLTGYHDGLEGYVYAATAMAQGILDDSVADSRYGNSPMPEDISSKDYDIENWNIPSEWTDLYDGITYKVRFGKNYKTVDYDPEALSQMEYYPVFPICAENVTVDTKVELPENAGYLFYLPSGLGLSTGYEGSVGHGWVGSAGLSREGRPDDYPISTYGGVKTFKFVGDGKIGSNVKSMKYMFRLRGYSWGLTEFDISKLDTSSATDMSHMFDINLHAGSAFKGLSSINTTNATNLNKMFVVTAYEATSPIDLTGDAVKNFKTSKVENMSEMFADSCIGNIDMSGFDFSSVKKMDKMFYRCLQLGKVTFPEESATAQVTDMSGFFQGCSNLAEINNLSGLCTSNVTNMSEMFGNYYYRLPRPYGAIDYPGPCVETLDISDFDTSQVTDMSGMFYLPKVSSLNVSGLRTGSVTNMESMFNLASVSSLDVNSFDINNVTNMSNMFTLDKVENFTFNRDTSNVVNMSNMFNLKAVKEFNICMDISSAKSLPSFNLDSCKSLKVSLVGDNSSVTSPMTFNAPKLDTLDLSGTNLNGYMLSQDSFGEYTTKSLIDIYLPKNLPNSWNSIPKLPTSFYIVGDAVEEGENPTEYDDFENLIGDKSACAILYQGGEPYDDPYSSRPVIGIEDAILLRAAKVQPVEDAFIKLRKLDEEGNEIYNEETGEYEYEEDEVTEITLYKYLSGYEVLAYPPTKSLFVRTVPEKPYPALSASWSISKNGEDASKPVISITDYNENAYVEALNEGTAEVTLTVEGYNDGSGSDVLTITKKVKVTVIPICRVSSFSISRYNLTMKVGESVDNPASAKNFSYPDVTPILSGVTYKSDNEAVATVDSNGKITAVAPGTANITVTIEDTYFKPLTCVVTVTGDSSQLTPAPAEPTATPTPTAAPTSAPTAEPGLPAVGTEEKSKDGKATYEVTGTTKDDKGNVVAEVTFKKPEGKAAKAATMTVPDQVTLADGNKAVVTKIAAKACYKNKKIKIVIIGKNVNYIGKNAFNGCSNAKEFKIKSKLLTKKSFGKNCMKNINKKAKIYLQKSLTKKKFNVVKKAIKSSGVPKTVAFKKKKM